MLGAGGLLAACGGSSTASSSAAGSPPSTGTIKPGGSLRVGATGGGAKDTIDAHLPTADPDIMRCWNLYEPLAVRPPSFGPLAMMVAESIEPEHNKADSWIVKIRPGIEFHNGKSVTADDVIFSLNRIIDPKSPKVGAASIGYIDLKGIKKLDKSTVRIPLKFANATFLDDIGQYFNAIVPVGYDPAKPVGTGAFMYESFTPGQQSVFKKFPNYWQSGKPSVDTLTIKDLCPHRNTRHLGVAKVLHRPRKVHRRRADPLAQQPVRHPRNGIRLVRQRRNPLQHSRDHRGSARIAAHTHHHLRTKLPEQPHAVKHSQRKISHRLQPCHQAHVLQLPRPYQLQPEPGLGHQLGLEAPRCPDEQDVCSMFIPQLTPNRQRRHNVPPRPTTSNRHAQRSIGFVHYSLLAIHCF